jgi:hypothetical protein
MVHALFLLQQENTSVQVGLVALDDRPLCRIEKREKVTSFRVYVKVGPSTVHSTFSGLNLYHTRCLF